MSEEGMGERLRRGNAGSMRASVSFPADVYEELERIAAAKKVSLAWVVRDAAERYVVEQGVDSRGGRGRA